MLQPVLPEILSDAVIPSVSLTRADRELWEDDEDEFIRRHVEGALPLLLLPGTTTLSVACCVLCLGVARDPRLCWRLAGVARAADEGADSMAFREDCVSARHSAISFVGIVAEREARAEPASGAGAGAGKRRGKGKRVSKRQRKSGTSKVTKHLQACITSLVADISGDAAAKPSAAKRRRSAEASPDPMHKESTHYSLLMLVGAASRNLGLKPAEVRAVGGSVGG